MSVFVYTGKAYYKDAYNLEDCIVKNLKKLFYSIPEVRVAEYKDRFEVTLRYFRDELDAKSLSCAVIKKWITNNRPVEFSKVSCKKRDFDGIEFMCVITKKVVGESKERKVIEAYSKSKEVYDLEDCIKSNLKKMFYRIPEFKVSDFSDRYTITIYPDDSDLRDMGSAAIIKKWVKSSGVSFSKMKCGKTQGARLSTELWCEVYK